MQNRKRNLAATIAGVIVLVGYGLMVLGEGQQTAVHASPAATQPAQPPERVKLTPKQPYSGDHGQLLAEREKNVQAEAQKLVTEYEQKLQQDPQWVKLQQAGAFQVQELMKWEQLVRTANGWDMSVTYDPDTDTWSKPAPAAAAKPAK